MSDLRKLTIEELQETYKRELGILNNKKLLEKLPDHGEQLKEKIKKIEDEIRLRKNLNTLQVTLDKLNLVDERLRSVDVRLRNADKHAQYVCTKEKEPTKERYKPFCTLSSTSKVVPNEHKVQKIPLPESMNLLKEQTVKVEHEFKDWREGKNEVDSHDESDGEQNEDSE